MGAVQSCLIYNFSTEPTTIFINSEEFRINFPAFKKEYCAVFHFCWTKRQRIISFQYDEISPELWNHDDDNQHLKSLRNGSNALRKTHGGIPIEWIPGSEPVILKKEELVDIMNYRSRNWDISWIFSSYSNKKSL